MGRVTQQALPSPYPSRMTGRRRRDLAFEAQGERIVARFVTASKVPRDEVERWIVRWAEQAERAGVRRDSPGYWNACRRWIAGQRESASAGREVA
jgi:hypothetical protein